MESPENLEQVRVRQVRDIEVENVTLDGLRTSFIVDPPNGMLPPLLPVHDARIIRLNGTHLPSATRSWLGGSIGHYEFQTLVVDATNFRRETHNLDSSERLTSWSASRASMPRRSGIA